MAEKGGFTEGIDSKLAKRNFGFWLCLEQFLPNGLVTLHFNGTGPRPGTGKEINGLLYVVKECSHWSETGTGTMTHCFLLCQSLFRILEALFAPYSQIP